nr:MAG TPA: hypothetical protein [Caudoviricetes sp.]
MMRFQQMTHFLVQREISLHLLLKVQLYQS